MKCKRNNYSLALVAIAAFTALILQPTESASASSSRLHRREANTPPETYGSGWDEWGKWDQCSSTCGKGQKTRTRKCKTYGCQGPAKDQQECNDGPCCTDWTDWGECSKTCGDGVQKRVMRCGDTYNPEVKTEKQDCNLKSCAVWENWTKWEECSVTCGEGSKTRTRSCSIPGECIDDGQGEVDTKPCDKGECPYWGEWTKWSECSVTCGKGEKTRTRTCSQPGLCPDDGFGETDSKPCDKGECPQWTPWETWAECDVLCGGGSRTRARTCPIPDGCAGLNEESSICNQVPCPDWGLWGPWADCTKTCGGGAQSRTRTCAILGACKPGEPFEPKAEACNPQDCPTWEQWAPWSECSVTCDEGQRTKVRVCTNGPGCLGRSEDIEPCTIQPCTADIFWSEWSPCTKTCDLGKQFRSRVTCVEGPPTCPQEQEDQDCNPQACPDWSEWGPWTECSRPCGKGQRERERSCPVVNGCVGQAKEIDATPCNDVPC